MTPSAFSATDATPTQWLIHRALPLWSAVGVDRSAGGFFEKIDLQGRPVEEPRRTRVVARQIYVFATAARRGWLKDGDAMVDHGLDFLLNRLRLPDGTYAAAVSATGQTLRDGFDLYEHAFVLFALAAASQARADQAPLRREAEALLERMRRGWGHPQGGFHESRPASLPLRSNPHMHLLEAALAWAELPGGAAGAVWESLAGEIVDLCLRRFIDSRGALREHFAADWGPVPGPAVIEPGHQFEWAWLLLRWADRTGAPAARRAGQRLLDIGEGHGVDARRGVAVNQLDDGFQVVDPAAKLWPQTERIKAWTIARRGGSAAQQADAPARLPLALAGLSRYLDDVPPGLWHEQLAEDGRFLLQDSRASSLYHIVCALATLDDALLSRGDAEGMSADTGG